MFSAEKKGGGELLSLIVHYGGLDFSQGRMFLCDASVCILCIQKLVKMTVGCRVIHSCRIISYLMQL
jgi:hypothetical protein